MHGTFTMKAASKAIAVLLLVQLSISPLLVTSTGAEPVSRQFWPASIETVPTLMEDQACTFRAIVPDASDDVISGLRFNWTFGDGLSNASNPDSVSVVGIATAVHIYTTSGTYDLTLNVRDPNGDETTATAKVEVWNRAPTPDISILRQSTFEDEPVTFVASGQLDTPSDVPTLEFSWAFGDEPATAFSDIRSVERTYEQSGTYSITLRIRDDDGMVSSITKQFTVDNQPPLAVGGPDIVAFETKPAIFDGARSMDTPSDKGKLTFHWDFGDGAIADGVNVTHAFQDSGNFVVTLTVTDDQGASTTDTIVVGVQNLAPVAVAKVVQEAGSSFVVLNADDSTDSKGDEPFLTYQWAFEDATVIDGWLVEHNFDKAGTHKVKLRVTDSHGAWSQAEAVVVVTNCAPSFRLHPVAEAWVDQLVDFTASDVIDPEGTKMQYVWDLGDSTAANWFTVNGSSIRTNHTYTRPGNFTIKLFVYDADNGMTYDEFPLEVKDPVPKAVLSAEGVGLVGLPLAFNASGSYDNPSDKAFLTYHWHFGDGTEATGKYVNHTYTAPGEFSAELQVIDVHGAIGKARAVVSILLESALSQLGGKVLRLDVQVDDTMDGEPGITTTEELRVTGQLNMVNGWTGPDMARKYPADVVVQIVGTKEEVRTTTGPDGRFVVLIDAPSKAGKFTIKTTATIGPLSAEASTDQKVSSLPTTASPTVTPVVAGVLLGATTVAAFGVIGGTDLGRYKFFTLMIPLFTRLRKARILDHFERGRIYEHIRKTPGDTYSSIRKALGIQNGALAHHLRVLEVNEYIISRRDGMYRRFYPKGMKIPEGKHKSIQEQMLEMIMANPKITQKEMAEKLGIDRSTVNYHVKILLAMGVIRSEKDGKVKYYYFVGIKDPLPYEA